MLKTSRDGSVYSDSCVQGSPASPDHAVSSFPLPGRKHRKANKHKADYVFVDLEQNNYVDMKQADSKRWKFLSFYPAARRRQK